MKLCLLIVVSTVFMSTSALADVSKYESAWGKNCDGAEDSYAIQLINELDKPIDYRICLKHMTGEWTCFVASNVAPGATGTSQWEHHVCDGTGDSQWWWRDAGDYADNFPNPKSDTNEVVES